MNPEQLNDDELCRAVAVEVLKLYLDLAANWRTKERDYVCRGSEITGFVFSPDGREAIEVEVKRREWGHLSTSDPGWEKTKSIVTVPSKHEGDSAYGPTTTFKFYSASDKNKFRSIAIAALKAARGE